MRQIRDCIINQVKIHVINCLIMTIAKKTSVLISLQWLQTVMKWKGNRFKKLRVANYPRKNCKQRTKCDSPISVIRLTCMCIQLMKTTQTRSRTNNKKKTSVTTKLQEKLHLKTFHSSFRSFFFSKNNEYKL